MNKNRIYNKFEDMVNDKIINYDKWRERFCRSDIIISQRLYVVNCGLKLSRKVLLDILEISNNRKVLIKNFEEQVEKLKTEDEFSGCITKLSKEEVIWYRNYGLDISVSILKKICKYFRGYKNVTDK